MRRAGKNVMLVWEGLCLRLYESSQGGAEWIGELRG